MSRRIGSKQAVSAYVLHRLRLEREEKRGKQAEIARRTGFTTAHLAQVLNGRTGVGDDFAHAMAAYWGITYAQLEIQAKEWAAQQPAAALVPRGGAPYLKLDARWPEELEKAKARSPAKKHPYLERAGDAVVPDRDLTWELIVRVADLLMATDEG